MPETILDYRSLKLIQERYSALNYYIEYHNIIKQNRIRCEWSLTNSLSGRMISKRPNLQTVPHANSIRGLDV
jgi:DNA polymerase I-like protein with 3'-5' exonuclease and polymerase domains